MATLTRQQLESNIQAMEKQGAKQPDIQAYLDTLKGPPVSRETSPSNFGAPAPTEQKDGFLKTLIKAPIESLLVKPLVRTAQAVEGVGREVLGLGSEEGRRGYEERISKDTKVPIPILGDIKVEPVKSGFAGAKQALGEGLEAGSYLIGGGAAKGVAQGAVKSTLGRGIVQGAKAGAKSGAVFGAGQGLQEDKDFGGIVGSTLTGAAVGGVAGGAVGGALTGARHTLLGKQSTAEEASTAAGRVFQASAKSPATQDYIEKTAPKILSKIDTTGVKSYDDLSRSLESHINRGLNEVDEAYKTSALKLQISKLDRVTEAKSETGRTIKVSQNFVKEALQDLEELYTKTRNPAEKGRIKALVQQAKNEGLSPFEINQLAREYGTTFKKKAFGAQGPLTSVNAVTYENTRKGLKSTARSFLETEALQNLDKEVSHTIRLKTMVDGMKGKVTALENRVKDRNLVEKLFRGVANVADVATFGGPKAFITKLFFPSNVGQKTLNSIDIQNELIKNLRVIRNLEHASDSTVISTLRDLAKKAGLIAPVSNFGARTPAPKLGSEAIAAGKVAVEKSVAKVPTARYTKPMTKSPLLQTSKDLEMSQKTKGRPPTPDLRKTSAQLEKSSKKPAIPRSETTPAQKAVAEGRVDKHGTPMSINGKGLGDPVEGGIYYHGTIKENKASLLKEGFNPTSNKKGFAEQSEAFYIGDYVEAAYYGDDMVGVRVKKGEKIKTLQVSDEEWSKVVGKSKSNKETAEGLRELRKRGYDAINYGDEIEILNANKFEIFDTKKEKSLFEMVTGKKPPEKSFNESKGAKKTNLNN